jgi:hypothetical protein
MHSKHRNTIIVAIPALILAAALSSGRAVAEAIPAAEPGSDAGVSTAALLKRINELEAAEKQLQERLDRLTAALPANTAAAGSPQKPAEPTPAAVEEQAPPDTSELAEGHTLGPVQFQGFSDFDFGKPWFEKLPEGGLHASTHSFNAGDFDLFTNTRISDHFSLLGELLITSDFSNEFAAEMDRLLLTYRQNDYFSVSVGKFTTALGYYSTAFNRAQYFQTGVGRPIMYSDEDNGGILPVHNIGVTATGVVPSGKLGLHWVAEVANGRSASEVPLQNFVDENNGKALNMQLYARPDWAPGLQTGVSVYRDTMYPAATGAISQTILTAHAAYLTRRVEWLNEASLVRDKVRESDQEFRSTTSYSQLAWAFGKTRPYFRYDYQNVPGSDHVFGVLGRRNGPSVGVSRHISSYVVLKLQYGRLAERNEPSANALTAQVALAF